MDTNKMRDISRGQFEAKFPVPAGVAWKESIGMYEVVDVWSLKNIHTIGEQNARWEGWLASREVVVVDVGDMEWAHVDEVIAAIEAQGLKVAP
ncbi:hypothetical protein MBA34_13630 [Pseudomonas capeferrum]|uniref:hypothetical protein n=1 Tax=Pseudomonas capeferrum TaxID=1495066 RepID=UPI0004D4A321|nr:hypothetical protein [Pseudomonas capeferrum]KEY87807.1 hypothetical protein PC358_01455 [Pseudomonas capeferrum]MCH7300080.1 hypothetical protein [Pseudomonas capeferrum]